LDASLRASRAEVESLKKANNDWPVAEDRIAVLSLEIPNLTAKLDDLKKERIIAEREIQNKQLRVKYATVIERKRLLESASDALSTFCALSKEVLDKMKDTQIRIRELESNLTASKIKLTFSAKRPME